MNTSIQINNHDIRDYLYIQVSPNVVSGAAMIVRVGKDTADNKTYIHNSFIIESENSKLPDIYFNPSDNIDLIKQTLNKDDITMDDVKTFVADAILTYKYLFTVTMIGDF